MARSSPLRGSCTSDVPPHRARDAPGREAVDALIDLGRAIEFRHEARLRAGRASRARRRDVDRARLERLCRNLARPPIARERLERLDDGRLEYDMKKPWRDGTYAIVLPGLRGYRDIASHYGGRGLQAAGAAPQKKALVFGPA